MLLAPHVVDTFPSVSLPSHCGGSPVEVALIAQLGIGGGDALIESARLRQSAHPEFVDALDEPSARIGAMHLAHGDASSLYSFAVGRGGHPFHRHAGPRMFTAVSGSRGALLRFCTIDDPALARDPRSFATALRQVQVPPDCLFTVRFGGGTWHQFHPLGGAASSPALFALSSHTNELGGDLSDSIRMQVLANTADIPSLTEVLPADIADDLERLDVRSFPTVTLALYASPQSWAGRACARVRAIAGPIRRRVAQWRGARGFRGTARSVLLDAGAAQAIPLGDGLAHAHHEDAVVAHLDAAEVGDRDAASLLAVLLGAFVDHAPPGVGRLMSLRNALVAPLRLRRSPLGCPVSSLLRDAPTRFSGFPVLDCAAGDAHAAVLLGADDRHLRFRTRVAVQRLDDGRARVVMATRVQCLNGFGRAYMAAISATHRGYVAPTMLRTAVDVVAQRA